jgi:hypothetical protein
MVPQYELWVFKNRGLGELRTEETGRRKGYEELHTLDLFTTYRNAPVKDEKMGGTRSTHGADDRDTFFVREPERKNPHGVLRSRREDDLHINKEYVASMERDSSTLNPVSATIRYISWGMLEITIQMNRLSKVKFETLTPIEA